MSSINISPVLKELAVIDAVTDKSCIVAMPSTVKFWWINTSLFGTEIIPVPLASNIKSVLVAVVLIVLLSTLIFSNWPNVLTVKLPVIVVSPVCV